MYSRPDDSGRHTLALRTRLGFAGSDTPVFENFYAGGQTSLRGFDFRGISPIENGVRVGGEFEWTNSIEYQFPITADDMLHAVAFVDFGTVESKIDINNFRVAPGVGLRVHVPFAGTVTPLAFDFAFPVSTGPGDDENQFSFYVGLLRQ